MFEVGVTTAAVNVLESTTTPSGKRTNVLKQNVTQNSLFSVSLVESRTFVISFILKSQST